MVATHADTDSRQKVRTNGTQSLVDVARIACGDVRLAALLGDLNPSLRGAKGALPAGTVVVLPAKSEARAFAKKLGFTIGFDPKSTNGTDARKKWQQHVGAQRVSAPVDAVALAKSLLARGVSPSEAGRRVAGQGADVAPLLASADAQLRAVGQVAELHLLMPKAQKRMQDARGLVEATRRPGALREILEAMVRDGGAMSALLDACVVVPALRDALRAEAQRVVQLLNRARTVAKMERGARDAVLAKEPDAALRALAEAFADGVEPLAGNRLVALDIGCEAAALDEHLKNLSTALTTAQDALGRAPPEAIKAIARGQVTPGLPRPWPLVATVCKGLAGALESAPAQSADLGLGGLVTRRSSRVSAEGAPVIRAAELQVRAASCARAMDEGEALAERLAPHVVELFGLMRPAPAIDGGAPQTRRARRKAAFEQALTAKSDVSPDGVARTVTEILARTKAPLTPAQVQGLDEVARGLAGPLSVARRPVSELGRALVVVAIAFERDVALGLLRSTGREALVSAMNRHAARVLSAAACKIC